MYFTMSRTYVACQCQGYCFYTLIKFTNKTDSVPALIFILKTVIWFCYETQSLLTLQIDFVIWLEIDVIFNQKFNWIF